MGKIYIKNPDVNKNKSLNDELMKIVERNEKQKIFPSLYDIEIMGVAVYYKKNWRYEVLSQDEESKELAYIGD